MSPVSLKSLVLTVLAGTVIAAQAQGQNSHNHRHHYNGPISTTLAPKPYAPTQYTFSGVSYGSADGWCYNASRQIGSLLWEAKAALAQEDYATVVNTLGGGLKSMSTTSTFGTQNGPLTARAINRGWEMFQALQYRLQGAQNEGPVLAHFLFNYYGFIQKLASELDRPYYIPYYESGFQPEYGPRAIREFENRLENYIRDQVQVVLNIMAKVNTGQLGPYSPNAAVIPLGNTEAFLEVVQIADKGAAYDLQSTYRGFEYICLAQELDAIGSKTHFANKPAAVAETYGRTEAAIAYIRPDSSCREWDADLWQPSYDSQDQNVEQNVEQDPNAKVIIRGKNNKVVINQEENNEQNVEQNP